MREDQKPQAEHLRASFEAWAASREGLWMEIDRLPATGVYRTDETRQAWDVWQAAHQFPAMTPELARILGTMCFQCISFAQALRAAGHQIEKRAEAEQAATLHWMLGHYFRHGDDWRKHAAADMERMRESAIAQAPNPITTGGGQ